jgi:hypothetical protein
VIAETGSRHPDVPEETLRAVIIQLIGSDYVEDAAAADPPELTGRDKARYDRARGYYRWLDVPRAPLPGRRRHSSGRQQ